MSINTRSLSCDNDKSAYLRVMWPHNASRKSRNATTENEASPAFLLHGGNAQLRQQKGRATVRAPGLLKVVHRDVGN